MRKIFLKKNIKQIIGVLLAVVGSIIVIQVVPISVWIFFLGVLLILIGWVFYRML
ncbi:hypothetical protein [Caloranaerobacter ferrireducens]|uniref:hypothetical protein n=1 Tax=Caloranaerobacter ferrireducens TaxID=1323370 RepID=UPI00159EF7F2|nr:hypothetical protein [Caloranaerobacter ferrireducens]